MKVKPVAVALAGIAAAILVVLFLPDARPGKRRCSHRNESWSEYDYLKVDDAGFTEGRSDILEEWMKRRDQPTMEAAPRFLTAPAGDG